MADISITPVAPRVFRVEVREGQGATTHQVTVPERLGEPLELREDDLERVVLESFRFLLEREPATSILRSSPSATSLATSLSIQASLNAACPEFPRSFSQR
jgi:hypothetical protein